MLVSRLEVDKWPMGREGGEREKGRTGKEG